MKSPVNRVLPLAILIALSAGAVIAKDRPVMVEPVTGPAADYPVVVGDSFTIDKTVWTPVDQLNYDAVGLAVVGAGEAVAITGAHKTLPLPSYVEVTALATGKTILVRLEHRGPMVNDVLVELSPGAAAQLGLAPTGKSAVRVRRVNPPEQERALLRTGGHAPERMATPEGLLKVLRRKLADQSPLVPPPSSPPPMPAGPPPETAAKAPVKPVPNPATKPAAKPAAEQPFPQKPATAAHMPVEKPVPAPAAAMQAAQKPAAAPKEATTKPDAGKAAATPAAKGSFVVQVAAFGVEGNARKVAAELGGTVSQSGKFWRVRLGPYTNRGQAAPALEKAHRAGYSGARIQPVD